MANGLIARLTLLASSLYADSAVAVAGCEDNGPWPCTEDGCPSPSISCEQLRHDCAQTFSAVWKTPPAELGAASIWTQCRKTCGKCGGATADSAAAAGKKPASSASSSSSTASTRASRCVKWRQTNDCSASGRLQPHADRDCDVRIKNGWSGYCECEGGVRAGESSCEHDEFTCDEQCAKQWEWLRQQQAKKQQEADGAGKDEEFSADDALTKLYKRGKQFYVMGNTELALRHFREALKLDPEHSKCKADYKQAKKLAKVMEKIEAIMGKDIEGKGRMKQLKRDEQYEEARVLLDEALALAPPNVYRSTLYRDLCTCNIKLRRREDALSVCTQHTSHDSGSMASMLLHAEALLLNDQFEAAMKEHRKVLEMDEHSQEARKGLEQAEKLYKRSKEIDYYKLLNVSRGASSREIKRAYHKLAVEYHPDKNIDDPATADVDEREQAQNKFKAVAQAYEVLSDEDMRRKYDAGEDVTGQPGEGEQQQPQGHWMHHGGQHVHVQFR